MVDVIKVASYISKRYEYQFGARIDEMKLHKLLYFTQRECIVEIGEPMFPEKFKAWRYGPVMMEIRQYYKNDALHETLSPELVDKYQKVFDVVFDIYASKQSWSLSILSHGEYAWKKAREGYSKDAACDVDMQTDDIFKDARRIKERRFIFSELERLEKSRLA